MSDKDLSKKILNKIKLKKIKPKPKWEFLLKDSVVWALILISLVVGSLATSVVIYMVDNNQWDIYKQINDNFITFVFVTLPYFWLIILMIFVWAIYYNFKHTHGGYKYRSYAVIITSVLISIVLGFAFYNIGMAQAIDTVFSEKMPLYQKIINPKAQLFNRPDKGILPGKVINVINIEEFSLIDPSRNQWKVIRTEKVIMVPVEEGQRLIIIGEKINDRIFQAHEIKPFIRKCNSQMPGGCGFNLFSGFGERKILNMRINN